MEERPSCLLHGDLLLVLDTFVLAALYLERYTLCVCGVLLNISAPGSSPRVVPHALALLRDHELPSKKKPYRLPLKSLHQHSGSLLLCVQHAEGHFFLSKELIWGLLALK